MVKKAKTFFLVPVGSDAPLTSMGLGLVRALQRDGIKAGFVKPIAQRVGLGRSVFSTHFARTICHIDAPSPLPSAHMETLLRTGRMSQLMEEVVNIVEPTRNDNDVVIIEGLLPDGDRQFDARVNVEMARGLASELILVVNASRHTPSELVESIELTTQQFGDDLKPSDVVGILINRIPSGAEGEQFMSDFRRLYSAAPVLAAAPTEDRLNAPRLLDVATALNLRVEHAGNMSRSRVHEVVVAARAVENLIDRLRPGALVVAPNDRSDVMLATALSVLRGVPLAGLLLTCGHTISPKIEPLMQSARLAGLPILSSDGDTFDTSARIAAYRAHLGADDVERAEQVLDFVSEYVKTDRLRKKIGEPSELRMPPPAFRHRLVESARKANKRIVLPEGDEPRTLQAAAICHEKKIAHCVLIGDEDRIRDIAAAQGVELPADIEIVDPNKAKAKYIPPMVELRKAKGMTEPQAEKELEDTVVLGTMMLANGDVDGLVSGAVHTTANTIRPALQLIKTAPGSSIVSSVFFMLMPDQVLVYGDCAVNPDPTAEQLADIAIQSADSAKQFGIEPRIAMISYSTGSSGSGDDVEKVRQATALAKEKRPDLLIDGPMQYDAASVLSVGKQKAPDSQVAGRANVFIFPDLNTGNTTYKAVQRSANVVSVGPMLQGLRKPVNDLSRGALVDDIVYTIALTAIQADAE
ncbi:phosphate acetyltransferase [Microvirga sp. W0021]|uniref:Phosphate acetyltransferase n=1 Tax=Hohaiivirga grylli TaxID=3133970 RepID=A0ABV0BGP7_9HYPH